MAPIDESVLAKLSEIEPGEELLEVLEKDFKRLKKQKARKTGGVEGRILLNLAFLGGEQHVSYKNQGLYSDKQDDGKLSLTFNLIGTRWTKLVGRICSVNLPYKARPDKRDPKSIANAQVIDVMVRAIDEKLDQSSRFWETVWWMGAAGVAFVHTPWTPNATQELVPEYSEDGELLFKDLHSEAIVTESEMEAQVASGRPRGSFELFETLQQVGDVDCEVLSPLCVFVDQTVKDLKSIPPDFWVHIAQIKTVGWVEENFDIKVEPDESVQIVSSQFHQLGEATGGIYLKDMIPLIQGTTDEDENQAVVVVKSYAPVSKKNPTGKYVCWIPGKRILHDDPNGNPYGEIPLVDFHWKPVTTSFWTGDYVTDLIAPQRFINKRLSQMGEQANNALYGGLMLAPGMTPADIPTDFPGTIENGLNDDGTPRVARLPGPELPGWFMLSMDKVLQLFNDVAGGADLFEQQKFPGQMRGSMAVPMLQEILDTPWGPLYLHIGERMARVQQQRLNRIKQFYPPVRTLHYLDRSHRDEVIEFHKEEILESGTNYSITLERGGIQPELRALREARVSERLMGPLSILYMDERTGKLDKSKIAAELSFGEPGREDKESQYRKLALELIERIWKGIPIPPPLPFYDHTIMMDELEGAMATTEFLSADVATQEAFLMRWNAHQQFLAQEAAAQQQAMQSGAIQSAVAQATQQAAAMAAADAVNSALQQVHAQQNTNPSAEELTRSAMEKENGRPGVSQRPEKRSTQRRPVSQGESLQGGKRA